MSAYYELYDSPCDPQELTAGRKPQPHARIVRSVTHPTTALITEISTRCTLTVADIKAVLQAASESISSHLAEGDRVHLDGLGDFYVSLQCEPEEGKKITARQVHFGRVHFLAEVSLKAHLNTMRPRLSPHPVLRSDRSKEERQKLLRHLLSEKELLTLREYRQVVGISGYAATCDVRDWQADGWLGRRGNRNCYWYYLKPKK